MTTNSKPLPKSLHTITALVAVARLHLQGQVAVSPERAVELALVTLGYSIDADPYGLADKALKTLTTEKRVKA